MEWDVYLILQLIQNIKPEEQQPIAKEFLIEFYDNMRALYPERDPLVSLGTVEKMYKHFSQGHTNSQHFFEMLLFYYSLHTKAADDFEFENQTLIRKPFNKLQHNGPLVFAFEPNRFFKLFPDYGKDVEAQYLKVINQRKAELEQAMLEWLIKSRLITEIDTDWRCSPRVHKILSDFQAVWHSEINKLKAHLCVDSFLATLNNSQKEYLLAMQFTLTLDFSYLEQIIKRQDLATIDDFLQDMAPVISQHGCCQEFITLVENLEETANILSDNEETDDEEQEFSVQTLS